MATHTQPGLNISLLYNPTELNGTIDIVKERLGALEDLQDFFYVQVCIVVDSGETEVLEFDVVNVWAFGVEADWRAFQFLVLVEREGWVQGFYDPVEVASSEFDVLDTEGYNFIPNFFISAMIPDSYGMS